MSPEVVIVNDYAHVNGGASQVALSSALALSRRGRCVRFFAAVPPVDELLTAAGVKVICTEQHDLLGDPQRVRAALHGIWNRPARRAFGCLLDMLSPAATVVHVHLWYKALSASVVREAVRRGFRAVLTLHDYTAVCPNGSFYNYQTRTVCRLRAFSSECLRTHCDLRGRGQKVWRVARNFTQSRLGLLPPGIRHFVCVSEFSRAILRDYLPAGAQIELIANPIDAQKGHPTPVERNEAFVCVGRLTAQKGPELFAEAARDASVPAVFVGEGELRGEVERLNPGATITGWLDRAATLEQMKRARALVFPSRCFETQGLAVAEAAALGVPAIVPDTSAAREMVADGETGLWFRSGDVGDLTEKMRRLQDAATASRMGRAAHERYWRDPMTLDRHVDRLEELYASLLHSEGHGTRSA